jgi:hypothetical protein
MAADSSDSKGWSLWGWPVIGTGAGIVYGAGLVALSFDQFALAAILLMGPIVCLTVKALTSPELSSHRWSVAKILVGSLLCVLSFLWVQSRLDSMAERHPSLPQANAPQAPLITWKTPASIEAGTPLSKRELNASAFFEGKPVNGRFVYNPALGATLLIGSDTLSVIFYPTDLAKYSTQTQTTTLTVRPASHPPSAHSASTRPSFAIEVDSILQSPDRNHNSGISLRYKTGVTRNFLTPSNVTLFVHLTNLQEFPSTISEYVFQAKTTDGQWIGLIRLDGTAGIPYWIDGQPLNDVSRLVPNNFDRQLESKIEPHQTVSGWAYFQYPPGSDTLRFVKDFKASVKDEAGARFEASDLTESSVSIRWGGLTPASHHEDLSGDQLGFWDSLKGVPLVRQQ